MRMDWGCVIRGVSLLAWAGFFDWLWLSGRAGDYVGPRTAWVVPVAWHRRRWERSRGSGCTSSPC